MSWWWWWSVIHIYRWWSVLMKQYLTAWLTQFRCWSAAQFLKATPLSGCEESNLDLSGRFAEGGFQLSKPVHVSTQTHVTDTETPAVRVWAPVDQATSTEGHLPDYRNVYCIYNLYLLLGFLVVFLYTLRACHADKPHVLPTGKSFFSRHVTSNAPCSLQEL